MDVAVVARGPAHLELRVFHPHVADVGGAGARPFVVGNVLHGEAVRAARAQDEPVEAVHLAVGKNAVLQPRRAVLTAKVEPQRVLRRVVVNAARTAVDAQAGFEVKAGGAVRLDPLDRGAALPRVAALLRVGIEAGGRVKKIGLGQRQAQRGQRAQRVANRVPWLRRGVHHIRIHRVIGGRGIADRPPRLIRAPRRVKTRGIHRLHLDAVDEKVALRVRVRRHEIGEHRRGAQHGRGVYIQQRAGRGRGRAVAGRGRTAVGRVDDRRAGSRRGDRGGERHVVVAAVHAERGVVHEAGVARVVQPARRGRSEIAVRQPMHRGQLRDEEKVGAVHGVVETVNREHIRPRVQQPDPRAQVDLLGDERVALQPVARGQRAHARARRHVAPRHFHAVEIDHAAVVVAQPQRERVEVRRGGERERHAHERRGAHAFHRRAHVCPNDRRVAPEHQRRPARGERGDVCIGERGRPNRKVVEQAGIVDRAVARAADPEPAKLLERVAVVAAEPERAVLPDLAARAVFAEDVVVPPALVVRRRRLIARDARLGRRARAGVEINRPV